MAYTSSREQLNENLRKLLNYFMQKSLTEHHYGRMAEVQQQKFEQNVALENIKNALMKDRAWQEWIFKISELPQVRQLQSVIFVKRQNNLDTSIEEEQLRNLTTDIARAGYKAVKGEELNENDLNKIGMLSDATLAQLLGDYGEMVRLRERLSRETEPRLALERQKLGLKGAELSIEAAKLQQKQTEIGDQQRKEMLSFVKDVEDFLISQGVRPSNMELKEFMQEAFSTGKVVNPLSPENQGAALQWLGELRVKLIRGIPLNDNEIRFLTTVRNVYGVQTGKYPQSILFGSQQGQLISPPATPSPAPSKGQPPEITPPPSGIVSPVTGMTGQEQESMNAIMEKMLRDKLYQMIIKSLQTFGITNDDALRMHAARIMELIK